MGSALSAVHERGADIRWALLIFGVALVLRTAFVVWLNPSPTAGGVTDDTWFYHNSAEALAHGHGYTVPGRDGAPTAQFPPGYSTVLAATYRLPGPDVPMGKVLNIILGSATCALVFGIGRLLWSRRVGIVAGLLYAFYPSSVFGATFLLSDVTYIAVLVGIVFGFLWALKRDAQLMSVAIPVGVALGLATLIRGEGLFLPLAFAAAWYWSKSSVKEGVKFAALAYLWLAIILSGWTVRNIIQMDAPIPVSTGSSRMAQAHWSGADGGSNDDRVRDLNALYPELPYPEREVKISRYSMKQGLRYLRTHPVHELSLVPRRLYFLYRSDHYATELIFRRPGAPSGATLERLRTVADAYYFITVAWAVLGLVLWWRFERAFAILFLGQVVALSALIGILYAGVERYHAELLPLLCLAAAPVILAALGALPWDRHGAAGSSGQAAES